MSTDNNMKYDFRINVYQKSLLSVALLTFITEGGFQGKASKEDLQEASELLTYLSDQDGHLEQGVINDLSPCC